MADALVICGGVLSATFMVAGISKLRHPAITATAATHFGLLRRPHVNFAYALGMAEVSLATLSWARPTLMSFGACAGLLALFTALIINSLRRGQRFHCGCFGSTTNDTIGTGTVLRTVVLLVASAVALLLASEHTTTLPERTWGALVGCLVVAGSMTGRQAHLLRQLSANRRSTVGAVR